MDQNKNKQGQQIPSKGNQQGVGKDQDSKGRVGQPNRDRSLAHDRSGQDVDNTPIDEQGETLAADLDEPEVEGVGNEGRGNVISKPTSIGDKSGNR